MFFAKVAELVDALDLGSSAFGVGVRVPPFAPYSYPNAMIAALGFFYLR